MKVKVAKTAGFCFGVKRAVDKVYQLIEEGVSPIYTLPIIHNEEVVSDLESRGVQVIQAEELDQIRDGTVVILARWSRERYLSETQRKQS